MKKEQGLKIVAIIPLGLATVVLLLFGVGEMVGGDWSGVGHLITAVIIIALILLGWKRPLWAGIPLLILGIWAASMFSLRNLAALLILIGPLLFSGLLLLGAAWAMRKK